MRTIDGHIKIFILANILKVLFLIQNKMLSVKSINYPKKFPCILAMFHSQQCVVNNFHDKKSLNVLISQSNDGEIVAQGVEALGMKTVRGSQKRNAVSSTLQLIEKLKQGENIAIMVDGPRGPKGIVKDGVINIAKNTGVPIIPVVWHSDAKNFLKFKTWDEMRFPLGFIKTVAFYGDPIYIPSELDKVQVKEHALMLQNKMNEMHDDLVNNYQKYYNELYTEKS